jgi:hypothetical protein
MPLVGSRSRHLPEESLCKLAVSSIYQSRVVMHPEPDFECTFQLKTMTEDCFAVKHTQASLALPRSSGKVDLRTVVPVKSEDLARLSAVTVNLFLFHRDTTTSWKYQYLYMAPFIYCAPKVATIPFRYI